MYLLQFEINNCLCLASEEYMEPSWACSLASQKYCLLLHPEPQLLKLWVFIFNGSAKDPIWMLFYEGLS